MEEREDNESRKKFTEEVREECVRSLLTERRRRMRMRREDEKEDLRSAEDEICQECGG